MFFPHHRNQCRTEDLRVARRQNPGLLHNMVHLKTLSVTQLVPSVQQKSSGVIDCNERKPEKRLECTNMGKLKRLELWWQLYVMSLSERDLRNFRSLDFCWTECTCAIRILFFWVMVLCARFRRNMVPSKPRETSKTCTIRGSRSFETSGIDHFVTRSHTSEERNTKPHSSKLTMIGEEILTGNHRDVTWDTDWTCSGRNWGESRNTSIRTAGLQTEI
jgi:hypothetical protein